MSVPESRRLERVERLLNYIIYILILEVGLTVGLVFLMQQLVELLSY